MSSPPVPPSHGPVLPGGEGLHDWAGWDESALDEHVPTDDELAGDWRDPLTGRPPEADGWIDELSAEERDAQLGPVDVAPPGPQAVGPGFADDGPHDAMPPGRVLAALADQVMEDGLGCLSDDELVGVLRASRRLAAWQDGIEMSAIAELDARRMRSAARRASSRANDQVSAELAAALTLTSRSAEALLGLSRDLARLPAVRRALLEGRIDLTRARIFAEELAGLGDVAAAAVAMGFADIGGAFTTGQLRAMLRAMVLSIDPDAARRRAERARDQARVEAWQESSGNMGLAGRELPAGDAIAADKRVTAIARALHDAGAPGTLDQLRAAVFAALLAGRDPASLVPETPADSAGPRSETSPNVERASSGPGGLAAMTGTVHLVMPAAAWLGLTDAPGEAAGLGPLDAWACRDLAARLAAGGKATRWQVTLTGPDGRAVAHAARAGPRPSGSRLAWLAGLQFDWMERGTCRHLRQLRRYEPSKRLAILVRARQRRCSFPGCRHPASGCDLDHTLAYHRGGPTCECNLSPLCRWHHRAKQAPGWQLDQPEPGTLVWTAPHGRSYTVTPEPYLT